MQHTKGLCPLYGDRDRVSRWDAPDATLFGGVRLGNLLMYYLYAFELLM